MLRSLILVLVAGALCAQSTFRPARFGGLVLGKAKERDFVAKFGKPKTRFEDRRGTLWIYYDDIAPAPGRVELVGDVKTTTINAIDWSPSAMTLNEVKALFGKGYKEVKFSSDTCLNDGGDTPIFEDPNGDIAFLVYDQLGVALNINTYPLVVEYLSEPLGPKKSRCPQQK
jgi:hypothetical protein